MLDIFVTILIVITSLFYTQEVIKEPVFGAPQNAGNVVRHITPETDSTYYLGTSSTRWAEGWLDLTTSGTYNASNASATSTFDGNLVIAEGRNLQTSNLIGFSPLTIDTDVDTMGYSSSTAGVYTQGDSHVGGNLSVDGTLTANIVGNADTATALAANGANCGAGEYALGVNASGVSESCTDATTEIDSSISTHTSDNDAHQALVTLDGTPDYITISGQTITRGNVVLTTDVSGTLPAGNGGTGATSLNNLITLTTHTAGNYAAGDAEAGNALTGDSASSFFSSGTLADARLETTIDRTIFNASDYVTALGGVHVGGTGDPGTNNLIVDGTTLLTGTVDITATIDVDYNSSTVIDLDRTDSTDNDYDYGYWMNGRAALTSDVFNGSWLRLNQNSSFVSGIYTPSHFRSDGEIRAGTADAGAYQLQSNNDLWVLDQVCIGVACADSNYSLSLPSSGTGNTGYGIARDWNTHSDSRLKLNQQELDFGLVEIMALQPKRYDQHGGQFIDGELVLDEEGQNTIGFVAQELNSVIPEAVNIPEDEANQLWSITYNKLFPVIVKAIQDQQGIINNQDIRLDTLEKKLEGVINENAIQQAYIKAIIADGAKYKDAEYQTTNTVTGEIHNVKIIH